MEFMCVSNICCQTSDVGDTNGFSAPGVALGGDAFRYDFSGFTWPAANISSLFLDERIDEIINATIDVRLVKGDDAEQTYTASFAFTVPGTGHFYSFTAGGTATKELKWIELDCMLPEQASSSVLSASSALGSSSVLAASLIPNSSVVGNLTALRNNPVGQQG